MNQEKYINSLENKINSLQLENRFLSESAFKEKLLNLIFETISTYDDEHIIFKKIADIIKRYLKIDFSGFFVLKRNFLIPVLTSENGTDIRISLSGDEIAQLDDNQSLKRKIKIKDTDIPVFIFPINTVSESYFFIIGDSEKNSLIENFKANILKVIPFLATKIEKIYYLNELLKLNSTLETKIKEKIKDVAEKNRQLEEQNEELKILNKNLQQVNEELVKTFKDLTTAKEKNRLLSDLGFEGLVIHEKFKIIEVNKKLCDYTGYNEEELIGKNIFDTLIDEKYANILNGNTRNEILVYRKNRSQFISQVESKKIQISPDEEMVITAIRDVTDEKEKESQLKKLSLAIEQSDNAVLITDIDGNIEYANQQFCAITGYKEEEVLGKKPRILKSGKQSTEFYKNLWNTILSGDIWKGIFLNKKKNEKFYWSKSSIFPIKNSAGEIANFIAIYEDITKEQLIKTELKRSKNLFEVTFNSIQDAILITDENNKISIINNAAQKIFGFKPEEIKNKSIDEILYLGNEIFTKSNEKVQNVFRLKNHKKEDFVAEISCTELEDDKKKRLGQVFVIRDITEKQNLIDQLFAAKAKAEESSRLKTVFLRNLSHEIRTPINAINGFSEFILQDNADKKEIKNYIKIIKNSSLQLLKIINDIVEISRLETEVVSINSEKIDLNNMIDGTFAKFSKKAKENNIHFYTTNLLEQKNITILSDKHYLGKILDKIIDNAFKNTSEGQIEIKTETQGDKLLISISDTGKGIAQSELEKIFEPFYSIDKNEEGLGLGLTIAKRYAELIGAEISVKSKLNEGSTFVVKIPFSADTENSKAEGKAEPKNKQPGNDKNKVMIVEDEEINLFLLNKLLQKYDNNIQILQATNGKKAVDVFSQNPDIKLILMDLKMPIMNGIEATKQIKLLDKNVPVIIQSAYNSQEEKTAAKEAGADDFLSKPIRKELLYSILDKYIGENRE